MVFGLSVFSSSGSAKEEKARLDGIQSLIDEHKEDRGDVNLDLFAQSAKDLRTALDVEIARGAKNPKALMRIEQLSDGILSNLESRITTEMLETKDGPVLAARCAEIAKDLDAVRATKASTIIMAHTDGLQEKAAQELLLKVKESYAEIAKEPPKILENAQCVIDAVEIAHGKAPTGKKVTEVLVNYCVQLARCLLNLLIQAMQADPGNAAIAKQVAERLDGIAEKLVAVLDANWDPAAAPQIEAKVEESAKKVFTHHAKMLEDAASKGAEIDVTKPGRDGIRDVLVYVQPWWPVSADVDGCGPALQAACEAVHGALAESFTAATGAKNKELCEELLTFAGELDTVTGKFDGIAVADTSLRSKMMDIAFSDVPAKLEALDVELAKEDLEVATVTMALNIMEGLVPMWSAAIADDDALPERLKKTVGALEDKIAETVGSEAISSTKALAFLKAAAKYEQLCTDLSLGDKSLQKMLAPSVAKSCLTAAEEEISKTQGSNPNVVLKAVEAFKLPQLKETVNDEEVKSRLVAALRATEDRVVDGYKKSVAEENLERMKKQQDFANTFNGLCQEIEPDIPEARHSLVQTLQMLACMGAAEKQVANGPEMDCAKLNKALDCLSTQCSPPKSAPDEIVTRMQAFCVQLRPALFARTLHAGEDRMAHILECARRSETARAVIEQREASEESGELCQALTHTKEVNKCLAVLDEELAKESGLNSQKVLQALETLKAAWASVANVGDFELRLISVFALLEERITTACADALKDGNLSKVEKLLNFGSRCDAVRQEADGDAQLCEQLAHVVVGHHISAAEKELNKESGMHPKKLLESIGHLPQFWARLQVVEHKSSKRCLVIAGEEVTCDMDSFIERLTALYDTMQERMVQALSNAETTQNKRKIKGLIKFASEYDSVFAELGLEGGLQERLSKQANSGLDEREDVDESANKDNGSAGSTAASASEAARAKLDAMKASDLQKLARSLGISAEDRDAASDADDPKGTLIEMIWMLQKPEIEAEEARRLEALEAEEARLRELKAMKSSALQKLARSLGVSEADCDEALDASDPKEALIALILPLQALEDPQKETNVLD